MVLWKKELIILGAVGFKYGTNIVLQNVRITQQGDTTADND